MEVRVEESAARFREGAIRFRSRGLKYLYLEAEESKHSLCLIK
jgi:hypothetical protein